MFEKVVEKDPWLMKYVPDHLKMQEMCYEKVVSYNLSQTILRPKRCVKKQLKNIHGY